MPKEVQPNPEEEENGLTERELSYFPKELIDEAKRNHALLQPSAAKKEIYEACSFIDNLVKDRIRQQTTVRRKFKDPDLYKDRDEEMEKLIGNEHLPSSLERRRLH